MADDKFTKAETHPYTPELLEAHQRMFGMTVPEMVPYIRDNLAFYNGDDLMLAMSMLSDTQEMIERGMTEDARQLINRVKWLLGEVRGAATPPSAAPKPAPKPQGFIVLACRTAESQFGEDQGPVKNDDGEDLIFGELSDAEAEADRLNAFRIPNVSYHACPLGTDCHDLEMHSYLKGGGWL